MLYAFSYPAVHLFAPLAVRIKATTKAFRGCSYSQTRQQPDSGLSSACKRSRAPKRPHGYLQELLCATQLRHYPFAVPNYCGSGRTLSSRGTSHGAALQRICTARLSPSRVRHMSLGPAASELDRSKFERKLSTRALRLPKQLCHRYVRLLKSALLSMPKLKAVQTDPKDPDKRLILLREDLNNLESDAVLARLMAPIQSDGVEIVTHSLSLDYTHMSLEMVLKDLLPDGSEIPGSFETVGHIAHLNLRDECLPYRHVIGQVVLDKNPGIKTVVNKVGSIENQYRVLPLEVIAGEDRLEATVKQHNARFMLHYAEVYWNSRLEHEHQRLVELFRPGEIVADVMAGIGPFAIPAGLKGTKVYANDLNPRSFHYLSRNIVLNKVSARVQAFQLDGREFIRRIAGWPMGPSPESSAAPAEGDIGEPPAATPEASQSRPEALEPTVFHHAVLNLPASAVEFLDAFNGAFDERLWQGAQMPLVHVYTFAKSAESNADIQRRVEASLGGGVGGPDFAIRPVRDVAPGKRMLRISFRVSREVAFRRSPGTGDEKAPKRQRTSIADVPRTDEVS